MEFVLEFPKHRVFKDADAITDLQKKVISEYTNLLCKVSKGYKPEYENILEEISLINMLEDNFISIDDSIFIIQYFLNNE